MQVFSAPEEIKDAEFVFTDGRFDLKATEAEEDRYVSELRAYVSENFGGHALAGEVVRVPYADGYAQYMVAKVNGKVSMIHMPLGDAWQDGRFERTATVAELKRLVEGEKALAALFGR